MKQQQMIIEPSEPPTVVPQLDNVTLPVTLPTGPLTRAAARKRQIKQEQQEHVCTFF